MADKINLIIQDGEDLQIVSAHLQDAIARVGDITYIPGERRFALMFNRFRWELVAKDVAATQGDYERVRTGLHFDDVTAAKVLGISRANGEAVLELLSIGFEEKAAPAGEVTLTFAGGGAIRLEVDCIEGLMRDVSDPWPAKTRPEHALDDAGE